MPRTPPELDRVARAQSGVVTHRQLVELGVPASTVRDRCAKTGPWQSPFPRVVVLHDGPLSVPQRYWSALLYAAGRSVPLAGPPPETLITGTAALALYRLPAAPAPEDVRVFDALVPVPRQVTPLPSVRVLRSRRIPSATRMAHRLPVAPLLRAAADAARQEPGMTGALYEIVQARRVPLDALARELGAVRLAHRADVRAVLDDLRVGVRSPAEGRARRVLEAEPNLPRPLWNPRLLLDGQWLADPDAYWPGHGVLFEVDSARHHAGVRQWEATMARHNRIQATGLRVLHASPRQLREQPDTVVAAVW
ncbi:hypothetical protein [Streptomyces sp. B6B3]|uniref:hypothetical protein n=1 Tax=Streptomyces sp. B6B3 TaxID=3153570 RepID=UPI00325E5F1E